MRFAISSLWIWLYFGGIALGMALEFILLVFLDTPTIVFFGPLYAWAAVFGVGASRIKPSVRPLVLAAGAAPLTFVGVLLFVAILIAIFDPVPILPIAMMLAGIATSDLGFADRHRSAPRPD